MQHTAASNLKTLQKFGLARAMPEWQANPMPRSRPHSATGFAITLGFEILTDHGPFCRTGLTGRLSFELIFNDYGRVIRSTDANAI